MQFSNFCLFVARSRDTNASRRQVMRKVLVDGAEEGFGPGKLLSCHNGHHNRQLDRPVG